MEAEGQYAGDGHPEEVVMRKQRFDRNRNRRVAEDQPTPVVCNARAYARFALWLDGELAKLERRWRHTAAPAARKPLSRIAFDSQIPSRMPKSKPKPK